MVVLKEVHSLLAYCYYLLASRVLQPILFLLFGPRISKDSENRLLSYSILADIKPFYELHHRGKQSFLLKFRGMHDLAYLDSEDVILYEVTEEEFVFVRTRPGVDIFNTEVHPFLYNIEHSAAVELLTAPHDAVYRYLRGKPARDGGNIAYLHNPGRCGSTLVSAMMFKTKQCVVLAEPNSIMSLALMFNRRDSPISRKTTNYLDLVSATFLLTCPDPEKLYFIKPWPCHTLSLLPLLHQALPGIKELFMYRSIRPSVASLKKLFGYNFVELGDRTVSLLPVNYRNIWRKIRCGKGDEAYSFAVLSCIHAYILETQDRDDIKAYSYESLLEDKEAFTLGMLQDIGIGEEHLDNALSALEKNSQANSDMISQLESWSRVNDLSVSSEVMEWIVSMARDELGIKIDSECGKLLGFPNQ